MPDPDRTDSTDGGVRSDGHVQAAQDGTLLSATQTGLVVRSGMDRRKGRRLEQDQLRNIVERLADGIVILSADGVIRFVNATAEKLFGRSAVRLRGTSLGLPVISGDNAEIEVVRPGGESVTVELRSVALDWQGEPARLVSLRDVTDRRRAEERAWQLERERAARAEAEAANQAKSEFLAMMSHELRTPLNAVIGYAELLDLGIAGPLNSDQRRQVQRIRTSGRHLLTLVNEVLDLAKIEAGRLSVQLGVHSSGDAADAALTVVQPYADSKGVQVSLSAGEAMPSYEGDDDRVRQILVNLLSNAVKFTPPSGSVKLELGETSEPDSGARLRGQRQRVFMRVTDTGIGIPEDQIHSIFDPFVQLSSGHTRSSDGSGLGLTISRRLARLMHGDISVRTREGEGSSFTLWLPAAAPRPEHSGAWVPPATPATRMRGLAEASELLLHELDSVLEAFVSRVRAGDFAPGAGSLKFSQIADHVGTLLAEAALMLMVLDELGDRPSTLLSGGTEIQRLVAERHGIQRGRLGWSVAAVHREFEILGEEVLRALRQRARGGRVGVAGEAAAVLARIIEQAEQHSVAALERADPAH